MLFISVDLTRMVKISRMIKVAIANPIDIVLFVKSARAVRTLMEAHPTHINKLYIPVFSTFISFLLK